MSHEILWPVFFANAISKKLILRMLNYLKGFFLGWLKSNPKKELVLVPAIKEN